MTDVNTIFVVLRLTVSFIKETNFGNKFRYDLYELKKLSFIICLFSKHHLWAATCFKGQSKRKMMVWFIGLYNNVVNNGRQCFNF